MNLAIYFALAYLTISLGEAFAPPLTMSSRADKIWEVEVRLGEETRMIAVRPGDSILTACELSQLRHPYDCRRGNCISCAGRFTPSSSRNLETYIVGPEGGKDPETFLCDEAKDEVQYQDRFDTEEVRAALREASASVMTGYAMRNPDRFKHTLEEQLAREQSEGGAGDGSDE